jgi:hypothetical protein
LVFNYDLPVDLSLTKDDGMYSLFWQKQAGTSDDAFSFKFTPPFGSVVEKISDGLNFSEGSFVAEGILTKDTEYSIDFK